MFRFCYNNEHGLLVDTPPEFSVTRHAFGLVIAAMEDFVEDEFYILYSWGQHGKCTIKVLLVSVDATIDVIADLDTATPAQDLDKVFFEFFTRSAQRAAESEDMIDKLRKEL